MLRPGDTIGIVAPASPVERDQLEAGCATLRRLGYTPVYDPSIFDAELYFAGSVERRARELQEMFARSDVHAIICARGGYGCNYLLPHIDLDLIRRHPKIFMGYSDVTTLLTYLCDAAGLITFHGPMAARDFAQPEGVDETSFRQLSQPAVTSVIAADSGLRSLVEGDARGQLYGGCLSLLVASLGTPYEINTEETILFLEDINAKPYQVDRMLTQLKLAGKLDAVRGIIFGEMKDCGAPAGSSYGLEDVVSRVVGDLHVPVAYGFPSGHVQARNRTIPIGASAFLEVSNTVTFGWEPAVATVDSQTAGSSKS